MKKVPENIIWPANLKNNHLQMSKKNQGSELKLNRWDEQPITYSWGDHWFTEIYIGKLYPKHSPDRQKNGKIWEEEWQKAWAELNRMGIYSVMHLETGIHFPVQGKRWKARDNTWIDNGPNFSELMKDTNSHIQEVPLTLSTVNKWKTTNKQAHTSGHILVKL